MIDKDFVKNQLRMIEDDINKKKKIVETVKYLMEFDLINYIFDLRIYMDNNEVVIEFGATKDEHFVMKIKFSHKDEVKINVSFVTFAKKSIAIETYVPYEKLKGILLYDVIKIKKVDNLIKM